MFYNKLSSTLCNFPRTKTCLLVFSPSARPSPRTKCRRDTTRH